MHTQKNLLEMYNFTSIHLWFVVFLILFFIFHKNSTSQSKYDLNYVP